MIKLIKELFNLMTPRQRLRFGMLQILVILMAVGEVIGIASIAPFMALVGDVSILGGNGFLAELHRSSGFEDPYDFVFWVGVAVLTCLSLSALLSMFTTWKLAMFAADVGTENADRLYQYYLNQNWLFHSSGSSSQLVNKIANEAMRVTDLIILPLILMIAKVVLALFIIIAIIIYDPFVAFCGMAIFGTCYSLLFGVAKNRLAKNGKALSDVATVRFRLMHEAFGGIKDVLLLNRKDYFVRKFKQSGREFAYARGNNHVLWQVPRYFIELLAFGGMIGLVLFLIVTHNGNLGTVLPILSIYALAAFKMLPAFQHIYASVGQIKGNLAAFEAIKLDLLALTKKSVSKASPTNDESDAKSLRAPARSIQLKNICFKFPGKEGFALNQLNMKIEARSIVGIVGPSGSGKSTAIDVLLSLIQPQVGKLLIDGTEVTPNNRAAWQGCIGFVPQSIFLSEGTIAENVAFGIAEEKIDIAQVEKVLRLSNLGDLIKSLEHGLDTKVGERGVQLSGGQRQRIGIARALYHEPEVLVLDEATSALDGITEKIIMEAIHEFGGEKTIIMIAHRIKTVEKCDQIFFIDQGRVVDHGTYNELLKNNDYFKRMTHHV